MAEPTIDQEWQSIRRMILVRDGYCCVECQEAVLPQDADVHHLLPRSMGGTDEPANLITLCDGCHAAHHPGLAGGLARRAIERWAIRLASFLDFLGTVPPETAHFGPALRLMGVDRFRDGQLAVVQAALNGKSLLVVRPTGSGKTLCFQLPAILKRGATVVISPLKALMAEQVSTLLRKKIPATYVNSDLNPQEKKLRYSLLRRGAIKLLHLAPERFYVRSDAERARLAELRPAFLVVDEAHCVDQWGNDFRPEYGKIAEIRSLLGNPPVLAFTATAGREMQQRILQSLGVEDGEVFVSGVDRPNIALVRWAMTEKKRANVIAYLLSLMRDLPGKAMIFVPSTRVGVDLQKDLLGLGHDVPLYHSKLGTPWEREQILKRFTDQSEPRIDYIIATSAFGMGLDVPGLRLVIHWQPPASIEDYLQEFGRAGRDGAPATAVVLHDVGRSNRDTNRLRFMAEQSSKDSEQTPNPALEARYAQIDKVAEVVAKPSCFRQEIIRHFESSAPQRQSWANWILEWLFSRRHKATRGDVCCDFCAGKVAANRFSFMASILQPELR